MTFILKVDPCWISPDISLILPHPQNLPRNFNQFRLLWSQSRVLKSTVGWLILLNSWNNLHPLHCTTSESLITDHSHVPPFSTSNGMSHLSFSTFPLSTSQFPFYGKHNFILSTIKSLCQLFGWTVRDKNVGARYASSTLFMAKYMVINFLTGYSSSLCVVVYLCHFFSSLLTQIFEI